MTGEVQFLPIILRTFPSEITYIILRVIGLHNVRLNSLLPTITPYRNIRNLGLKRQYQ